MILRVGFVRLHANGVVAFDGDEQRAQWLPAELREITAVFASLRNAPEIWI